MRSSANLIIENDDKYCFLWSILAYLHPCNDNHPNRLSNYRQYFNKFNIQDFDFTNGFKCNDVHKFEKLNILSINIFELNFHQDQNKWRHKPVPIEVIKSDSEKVINLIIYKNHDELNKKLNVFSGDHHKIFICTRCLNSCTSKSMLMLHKLKCGEDDLCSIRTSSESRFRWKKHFHENPLYFRIYADFEADHETDNSSIGNKTTNLFKLNPMLNGYNILSELEDVLKSGFYNSPSNYNNVGWFVNEVIKLENKLADYFKKN